MVISEDQQFLEIMEKLGLYFCLDFFFGKIVPIDIPTYIRFSKEFHIVFPSEQTNVVHLRSPWYEKLNRPGNQIGFFILPQSFEIRTIYLVQI